jgi:glycerol kinase
MSILVIDVGTSSVRAAIVEPDATVTHVQQRSLPPSIPFPGLVEIDAVAMAAAVLDAATAALAAGGPVEAVGIANQRASTIVWDRASGQPVGLGLGWQDLRTVFDCLALKAEGQPMLPSQSATKLASLLDQHDPERSRDLCFGTVDSWVVWTLTQGAVHVTDATNAGVTGFRSLDGTEWDQKILQRLRIDPAVLPTVVDSIGIVGQATALPGAPPIAGIVGDQQASLIGQGCVRPGLAKITFGTGGMLDACVGEQRPAFPYRGEQGCFPVVGWQAGGRITWGVEAMMLTAGTAVDWLVEDLGLLANAAESDAVAAQCADTAGAAFVPALLGLGTPHWDFGARGTLTGVSRGVGKAQVVRAVLEGVAHRGADLVEAAEADTSSTFEGLRIDGGMTANATFVQAMANATGRPVEVSPVLEATTLGAAFVAGLAIGTWSGLDDVAAVWKPRDIVEPSQPLDRDRWRAAVERAERWEPELSALDF